MTSIYYGSYTIGYILWRWYGLIIRMDVISLVNKYLFVIQIVLIETKLYSISFVQPKRNVIQII